MKEAEEVIQALQQQITFAQDNINDCQMSIMQVEENKVTLSYIFLYHAFVKSELVNVFVLS